MRLVPAQARQRVEELHEGLREARRACYHVGGVHRTPHAHRLQRALRIRLRETRTCLVALLLGGGNVVVGGGAGGRFIEASVGGTGGREAGEKLDGSEKVESVGVGGVV